MFPCNGIPLRSVASLLLTLFARDLPPPGPRQLGRRRPQPSRLSAPARVFPPGGAMHLQHSGERIAGDAAPLGVAPGRHQLRLPAAASRSRAAEALELRGPRSGEVAGRQRQRQQQPNVYQARRVVRSRRHYVVGRYRRPSPPRRREEEQVSSKAARLARSPAVVRLEQHVVLPARRLPARGQKRAAVFSQQPKRPHTFPPEVRSAGDAQGPKLLPVPGSDGPAPSSEEQRRAVRSRARPAVPPPGRRHARGAQAKSSQLLRLRAYVLLPHTDVHRGRGDPSYRL